MDDFAFRALCDIAFEHLTEKEKLYQFSTPKVHKIFKILKTFTPFYANKESSKVEVKSTNVNESAKTEARPRRFGNTWKGSEDGNRRPKPRYTRILMEPDVLCGVIFVDQSFTAKVLFYLLNVRIMNINVEIMKYS